MKHKKAIAAMRSLLVVLAMFVGVSAFAQNVARGAPVGKRPVVLAPYKPKGVTRFGPLLFYILEYSGII